MKTLDEVIEACEKCYGSNVDCDNCQYTVVNGEGVTICAKCELEDETLHYLKTLRAERKHLDELWRELVKENDNNPLTWDELKMMTGKPIWIEDAFEKGEWYIIECFTDSNRFIAHDRWAGDDVFRKLYMGAEWFAYRKERNEDG